MMSSGWPSALGTRSNHDPNHGADGYASILMNVINDKGAIRILVPVHHLVLQCLYRRYALFQVPFKFSTFLFPVDSVGISPVYRAYHL